ncbi:hypothetical protein P9173_09490 [Bacillus safensis]|uniref:hypothetical protein n=1 Tax=Bacillus safensis TaxID=561879 RepID=UPI00227F4234|nr:hypothetical protein [Bacillus safensis]MCY7542466.1 hypothetical protein [Bacillus safensis]MCY7552585.1 hypothetical protein [Bacillus safensis]MCY7644772.1 hypothetical protein [Bacillus safensis]MCY7655913.1 hypothetical protein [Bacillus safensis]MEC3710388.1 hypothetical protein [Bacillus safensis]
MANKYRACFAISADTFLVIEDVENTEAAYKKADLVMTPYELTTDIILKIGDREIKLESGCLDITLENVEEID